MKPIWEQPNTVISWIRHTLLHHLVSFLLVTQITRLKKSSKGVIYEESLHRRSASTWPQRHTYSHCNVPAPTTPAGFETWADSTLRVASQRSNQLGQRVRPAGEKLAGRLDCHTTMTPHSEIISMQKTSDLPFECCWFLNQNTKIYLPAGPQWKWITPYKILAKTLPNIKLFCHIIISVYWVLFDINQNFSIFFY